MKNWRQGTSAEEIINFTTTAIIATNNHQKWGGGGLTGKGHVGGGTGPCELKTSSSDYSVFPGVSHRELFILSFLRQIFLEVLRSMRPCSTRLAFS